MVQATKLIRDNRGTTAVTVAVALPVLMAAVGAAIDLGTLVSARTDLAHLTKLACTRQATAGARGFSSNDQITLTAATVSAHMRDMQLDMPNTHFDLRPANGQTITVSSRSKVNTKFVKMFGVDDFDVAAVEQCDYQLQVPTIEPNTSCDATIPTGSAAGNFNINLNQARTDWRRHNEVCNASGCVQPAAPDEMIVTVLDSNGEIIERDLLSDQSGRGQSTVSYRSLPGGSRTTVQPVNGYPWQLPEACSIAPPTPAPPPPTVAPPATPSGGGGGSGSCGGTGASVLGPATQVTGSAGSGSGGSSAGTGSSGGGFNTGGGSVGNFNGTSGSTTTTSSSTSGANGGANNVSGCVTVQNGTGT